MRLFQMQESVFFDRDGTIIKDKHYIAKVEDIEFVENIAEEVRTAAEQAVKQDK